MKPYADSPLRRLRQVVGDLLLVLWIVGCVWLGTAVHDATEVLAGPGRQTAESATGMADGLREAGDRLGGVPLVGDEVASPFEAAAGQADRLAGAGRDTAAAVERLADRLGVAVAAVPVLLAAGLYLPPRWRFARRAAAGARLVDSAADLDLFALRALGSQPLHVLARVSDDPTGAWRRGDPEVVRRLAVLELRDAGLRPPPA